ncbi:hypothetical protein AKO1_008376, partial [Acrasis kona]
MHSLMSIDHMMKSKANNNLLKFVCVSMFYPEEGVDAAAIQCAAVSDCEKYLLACCDDGRIRVWLVPQQGENLNVPQALQAKQKYSNATSQALRSANHGFKAQKVSPAVVYDLKVKSRVTQIIWKQDYLLLVFELFLIVVKLSHQPGGLEITQLCKYTIQTTCNSISIKDDASYMITSLSNVGVIFLNGERTVSTPYKTTTMFHDAHLGHNWFFSPHKFYVVSDNGVAISSHSITEYMFKQTPLYHARVVVASCYDQNHKLVYKVLDMNDGGRCTYVRKDSDVLYGDADPFPNKADKIKDVQKHLIIVNNTIVYTVYIRNNGELVSIVKRDY